MSYFNKYHIYNQNRNPASESLTENEVITFLDQYLTNFEQNLRDNNFDRMNTSLVKNLITQFGKILHLWEQNLIFQHSINQADVKNIYKSMHHIFGTGHDQNYKPIDAVDTNAFSLECNRCGDSFPLRNNNCLYSYKAHSLTKEHLEFIRNLNDSDDDSDTAGDATDIETNTSNLKKKDYVPALQLHLNNIDMKFEQSVPEEDAYVKSALSAENDHGDADFSYIYGYEQLFNFYARCNLCCDRILFGYLDSKVKDAVVGKAVKAHLEAPFHRRKVDELYRDNKKYVEVVNLKSNIFKCTLCEQSLFLEGLIRHFQSINHQDRVVATAGHVPGTETDWEEEDYVPASQPQIAPDNKRLYMKLDKLYIDKEKRETLPVPALSKKGVIAKKQTSTVEDYSISVFDANCIIFKYNFIRCKICSVPLKGKASVLNHFAGAKHLNNSKKYESFIGDFVKESCYEIRCTLCNYSATEYDFFFNHCQSKIHLQKLKDSAISYHFPDFSIQKNAAEKIRCPSAECASYFSGLSQLYAHARSIHGIIAT